MINPWEYAKVNKEHAHQTALFIWANVAKQFLPPLDMLFAIPNGGERAKIVAARMRAEGVKAGVPDMFLPYSSQGAYGLFIELKRLKGDSIKPVVSRDQINWQTKLRGSGYQCAICYGWQEAKSVLVWYLLGDQDKARELDANVKLAFQFSDTV